MTEVKMPATEIVTEIDGTVTLTVGFLTPNEMVQMLMTYDMICNTRRINHIIDTEKSLPTELFPVSLTSREYADSVGLVVTDGGIREKS